MEGPATVCEEGGREATNLLVHIGAGQQAWISTANSAPTTPEALSSPFVTHLASTPPLQVGGCLLHFLRGFL